MASIITIHAKGNTKAEIDKKLEIIDSYMNLNQNIFILVSSRNPSFNPRIYYSEITVIPKMIYDIITSLKTDKEINYAIREIAYSGNLNKK